jgi:hypothetical protein
MTCQIDSVSATHLFNYYQLTRFSPRQVFGQLEGNKAAELYLLSSVDDAHSGYARIRTPEKLRAVPDHLPIPACL